MSPSENFQYEEKRGFLQRYGFVLGIGVVAVVAVIFLSVALSHSKSDAQPPREVTMVNITPPPPTPPPPVQTSQTVPEHKMTEVQQLDDQESKADDKPQDEPAPGIGTGIKGPGGDNGFGVTKNGSSGFFRGEGSGGSGRSNPYGRYFGMLQRSVQDALNKSPAISKAKFRSNIQLWQDVTGRIIRAKLAVSTGNLTLDEEIVKALTEVQQEPPPEGLEMPIVIRIEARRPN